MSSRSAVTPLELSDEHGPVDGTYDVIRPIAVGGMGRVFAARHRHTARCVAIKVLREEHRARRDVVARLRREALMLGSISHPNVVNIVDAGDCAEQGPFLALELLEGRSIEGLLAVRRALSYDQVLRVVREVALALRAVHRAGFVHRDIKPGNIFVAVGHDALESVKVLDFGIACESDSKTPPDRRLTRPGEVLGTPSFMAPEQLTSPSAVDGRGDLYALGVSALECLACEGATDLGLRMRTRNVATHLLRGREDVPEAFVEILDGLLASDVAERCATAVELLAQLERCAPSSLPSAHLLGYWLPPAGRLTTGRAVAGPDAASGDAVAGGARRAVRAPYATPIRISQGDRVAYGQAEDISEGGLLVMTEASIDFDVPSVVRFNLPTSGKIVNIPVQPRWRKTDGKRTAIGLEFAVLDPVSREAIRTYVEWFAK